VTARVTRMYAALRVASHINYQLVQECVGWFQAIEYLGRFWNLCRTRKHFGWLCEPSGCGHNVRTHTCVWCGSYASSL